MWRLVAVFETVATEDEESQLVEKNVFCTTDKRVFDKLVDIVYVITNNLSLQNLSLSLDFGCLSNCSAIVLSFTNRHAKDELALVVQFMKQMFVVVADQSA